MSNRLARETSPYLQQHAVNPVDWYPWSEEALVAARDGDKPILLSVGYSACHWCHVMAHECFEDDETAALMNRHFVNIKVDREERPDIDQIYQTAHQLIARGPGGWPLTMFLTPDGKPFYGGTYFPKRPRYGRPGFDQLLERVAELWAGERSELVKQGDALVRALESTVTGRRTGSAHRDSGAIGDRGGVQPGGVVGDVGDVGALESIARQAGGDLRQVLMQSFDARHGGFGGAPKFPHSSNLDALLRQAVSAGDDTARDAVVLTLRRMAEGGLYDQLGGGFYRYSTDERWLIPHFEKMLYDNGPLLRLYAEAWQLTREPLFRDVCAGTARWLIREMQSESGGYFSSLDADSEGEEGKFYVWGRDEIAAHLDAEEFAAFAARYGLDGAPNFEGGSWHLHVTRTIAEVAALTGRPQADCAASIGHARQKLSALRATRVRPGRDDKILTSWNALAIDGMLFAARVLGEPAWAISARRALDFIRSDLWRDGRLLATHKDGRSHLNAYLDDHAFMLGALLEAMQQHQVDRVDIGWATALAQLLLQQFEDTAAGGFFFTSHDHEKLVLRTKPAQDGSTASGNGTAALYLQRFGHLVGEMHYLQSAERTMTLFAGEVGRVPHAFGTLVSAMAEFADSPPIVILAGPAEAAGTLAEWRSLLAGRHQPGSIVVALPENVEGLPDVIAKPRGAHAEAWVCRGAQCLPPVGDTDALIEALGK